MTIRQSRSVCAQCGSEAVAPKSLCCGVAVVTPSEFANDPLHQQQVKVQEFLERIYKTDPLRFHEDLFGQTRDSLSDKQKAPFPPNSFYDFSCNLLQVAEDCGNSAVFHEALTANPFDAFSEEEKQELIKLCYSEGPPQ